MNTHILYCVFPFKPCTLITLLKGSLFIPGSFDSDGLPVGRGILKIGPWAENIKEPKKKAARSRQRQKESKEEEKKKKGKREEPENKSCLKIGQAFGNPIEILEANFFLGAYST